MEHDPEQFSLIPGTAMAFPGAGQVARAKARESQEGTIGHNYRRIAAALEAHGPLTRKSLADALDMNINTVNARVSEMRMFGADVPWKLTAFGRLGGESVLHLHNLRTWENPVWRAEYDRRVDAEDAAKREARRVHRR